MILYYAERIGSVKSFFEHVQNQLMKNWLIYKLCYQLSHKPSNVFIRIRKDIFQTMYLFRYMNM